MKMMSSKSERKKKKGREVTTPSKTVKEDEAVLLKTLKATINDVRNMKIIPPVYVYSVKTDSNASASLGAVDVSKDCDLIAACFAESSEIFIKIQPKEIHRSDLNEICESIKASTEESKERFLHFQCDAPEKYLNGHDFPVTGLKCMPQKNLLLSCSLDKTVRAWNLENFITEQIYSNVSAEEYYCDIDVSHNSSYFVTCGFKGIVSLFSLDRKYPVRSFPGHTDVVNCVRFHPNSIYIATASSDHTIKLWNSQSGSVARTFQDDGSPKTLSFSPDGKYLASYSGGCIKIWDLASGKLLNMCFDSDKEAGPYSLCFSQFNGILASGGAQKKLKMWDVSNLSSKHEADSQERSADSGCPVLKSHTFNRKIQLLKFDENNVFTCVTA